ncbi:3'-phosphoadenylsulfate reductase [Mycoemilia scoparia]|uniref:3'-phosphoadenylsulfate reductase n=1 Tax=Mycoemilia scoparia TaxID=417184 RepID=A0A9W8DVJ9_9FUNG|nr:3'-phosphoadenylsulfate reductase [Mycoemilia scoparia]
MPSTIPTSAAAASLPSTVDASNIDEVNRLLENCSPREILTWAVSTFDNLYQETAFGPSGNVITDMISASNISVPVIFVDTLHHFKETLDLASRSQKKYGFRLHVYRPENCESESEFASRYGEELWKNDDVSYDYLVKVEPARRAYRELNARAVITGRRRSQKGDRSKLNILEIEKGTGMFKLNPLALWSFQLVWSYLCANEVPYNVLLDQGYKSIGDYHSTNPVREGEDERSGRWSGSNKTECGLHKDYFAMRSEFLARKKTMSAQQVTV